MDISKKHTPANCPSDTSVFFIFKHKHWKTTSDADNVMDDCILVYPIVCSEDRFWCSIVFWVFDPFMTFNIHIMWLPPEDGRIIQLIAIASDPDPEAGYRAGKNMLAGKRLAPIRIPVGDDDNHFNEKAIYVQRKGLESQSKGGHASAFGRFCCRSVSWALARS